MTNKYCYISIGEHSIYYTLREKRVEPVYTEKDDYGNYHSQYDWVDYYLFNLSTDKNEAIEKAKEYSEKNNIRLYGTSDNLIVENKIGDAKTERENKYGVSGGFVEKKKSDEPTVWKINKRTPEEIEADRIKREKEQAELDLRNKEALDFYKNPVWAKIRKHLFWEYIHSQNCQLPDNLLIDIYHPNSLKNRKKIKWVFDNMSSNFVSEMYRNIKNKIIISGRALDIVFEIYAKQSGRKGSKAYKKALNELQDKVAL